ncbi:hypothetical protein PV327_008008 [Microctonus hyperodae]|uniref:Major facilitator superfamily (MFS) profile domain-containing protein n=1 Tax=Microctonus hyperodae TaxID=165561 RepID=A0AA39G1S4_MICHY|nr:hypothetical protein PV327_008008 [Microctonus hyperodae]
MSSDAVIPCLEESKPPIISTRGKQGEGNENDESEQDIGGWTPLLVLAGATCCFGSALPAGYNIGVVNNPADIIKEFCNNSIEAQYNIKITKDQLKFIWSVVVSISLIGGVTGSLMASCIADKYGRRLGLAIGNIFGFIGAILFLITPASKSVEVLIAGRLMVGFSGGIATSLLSMYMMEIAPLRQRGAVGVFCQLGITVGVFLGQVAGLDSVLGTTNSWHIMLASFAPLCIIAFILLYFLPESPKYLYLIKHKKEEAIQGLLRLRNVHINLLQKEIQSLHHESTVNSTIDSWSIGRVLKDPSLRLPLLLVSSLQLGQPLSGINSVFYYSTEIFKTAQLTRIQSQYATLGTGVINIAMAVISVRIMSHFGRRTLFFCSSYASAACLVVLALGYHYIAHGSIMIWLCTASVLIYVLTYGLGLGPIPYFIASELFDVGPRPAAMAIGSVCNWGGNFIVGLLFPSIFNVIGAFTFLIFVAFIIIVALFMRTYLPETRNVDTTIITAQLSYGFKSRPNPISNA